MSDIFIGLDIFLSITVIGRKLKPELGQSVFDGYNSM